MTYGLVPLKVYLLHPVQAKCLSQFISICEKKVLQQPFFNNTSGLLLILFYQQKIQLSSNIL